MQLLLFANNMYWLSKQNEFIIMDHNCALNCPNLFNKMHSTARG